MLQASRKSRIEAVQTLVSSIIRFVRTQTAADKLAATRVGIRLSDRARVPAALHAGHTVWVPHPRGRAVSQSSCHNAAILFCAWAGTV